MLLACLALGLISCRDTIDPREARPPSQVQQEISGPVMVLHLTCTLSFSGGQKGEVSCGEPGTGKKGVSQSVILPVFSEYARWLPFNLVKDTVTETWSFISSVQNLLAQPIGTLDGATAVGTKVAITYGPVATVGTGTVSVMNADGTGNFTAPNQPYFNYPQIIQPQAFSPYRTLNFHVPNTVTEVAMGIAISTDFPATQNVAITPPDSIPGWIDSPTSLHAPTDSIPFRYMENVVRVVFLDNSTLAERQLAVALVGGTVIGGQLFDSQTGVYYLSVDDDGSGMQLWNAIRRLKELPQVQLASPIIELSEMYLRPNDSGNWQANNWRLDPINADQGSQRWALEEVEAPMAWGCTVGDAGTRVGIIDHGFPGTNVTDLQGALPDSSYALNPADSGQHGTHVASVIAAEGDNGIGITGMMWHASFDLEDAKLSASGLVKLTQHTLADRLVKLVNRGVGVINVSIGIPYTITGTDIPRRPGTRPDGTGSSPADSIMVGDVGAFVAFELRHGATRPLPLIVIAADNFSYAGANGQINSWWGGLPILRDSFPDNVIVVGASTKGRSVADFSGNNVAEPNRAPHNYVEIMAPGEDVYVLDRTNHVVARSGTSVAAPMVTGTAGLLLSFDPSLASSPAELKRLILAGADSSWDVAGANERERHVEGNGGPYRLLNAYEPLKLAAQRPTASICGNRMWAADNQVWVQRNPSSSTAQSIYNAGEGIGWMDVMHLGVINLYTASGERHLEYQGGSWMDASGLSPSTLWGGPDQSADGDSHNNDSTAYVSDEEAQGNAVHVYVADEDSYRRVTSTPIPILPYPSDTRCMVREQLADSTSQCNEYTDLAWLGTGDLYRATTVGYSPHGDEVFVALTGYSDINATPETWDNCLAAGLSCLNVTFERVPDSTVVYAVTIANGATSKLFTVQDRVITRLGASEGGAKELFYYTEETHASIHVHHWYWETAFLPSTSCAVEFRARTATSPALSKSFPCDQDYRGTLAPMRVARDGGELRR